jgi:hypothetical protein
MRMPTKSSGGSSESPTASSLPASGLLSLPRTARGRGDLALRKDVGLPPLCDYVCGELALPLAPDIRVVPRHFAFVPEAVVANGVTIVCAIGCVDACGNRVLAAVGREVFRCQSVRNRRKRPAAANPAPERRGMRRPVGTTFSTMIKIASPAIHSTFMTPPTKRSAISTQQHPTQ